MKKNTASTQTGELRRDLELFPGEADESGKESWIIFDPVADRYFRISEKEHNIIRRFNKARELEKTIKLLHTDGLDITESELSAINAFLHHNNLLMPTYKTTENRLHAARKFKRKMLPTRILNSYLFFKIPLWKPDGFLNNTLPVIKSIFNRWNLLFIAALSLIGYFQVIINFNKVSSIVLESFTSAGMVRYIMTIIILKIFHELAHAYTAKRLGIRVRRMGISFIVFFPRLYTDVTDSWRIKDRKKRALIDVAGIASELMFGGFAAFIWSNTGPGLPNTIAYYIFAISTVSTVFINGNPFIRYDGYYLLMDITGIDNLQRRGSKRIKEFFRKYMWGIPTEQNETKKWKNIFLIIYGISAFVYRFFLYTSIILIVYYKFTKTIGIILMSLEIYLLILKPLTLEIKSLLKMKKMMRKQNKIISLITLCFIASVLLLPLPWNISIPGVVKSGNTYYVRAIENGFISEICSLEHIKVRKGDVLLKQKNQFLDWNEQSTRLRIKINETMNDQMLTDVKNHPYTRLEKQEYEKLNNQLNNICKKKSKLTVRAPFSGIFSCYNDRLHIGKWIIKGELIGELYKPDNNIVAGYTEENNLKDLKIGDKVTFTLTNDLTTYKARIKKINSVSAMSFTSPSPLLQTFGGPLKTSGNLKLKKHYYQITVNISSNKTLPTGRTGTINICKHSSLGLTLFRDALNFLQREF